jgi:hypothetical protein
MMAAMPSFLLAATTPGLGCWYIAQSCGILDIIDRSSADTLLETWRNGGPIDNGCIAVLFLILAYGAQARSAGTVDSQFSEYYYHHGRQLALLELTDEPRLETVQAFVLISLYMLAMSQRNGSFLNLGIAISAAKSLGFHRDDVNAMFPEDSTHLRYLMPTSCCKELGFNRCCRTRIWRSLRYHDLFFCAMMGRTPSTMTTDSYSLGKQAEEYNLSSSDPGQQSALIEALRAFSILERTVSQIYTKSNASLAHLESLARELQAATLSIAPELRTVDSFDNSNQRHVIRNTHVACSYYFCMMILTRPFLITSIQQRCSRAGEATVVDGSPSELKDSSVNAEIMQGTLASIDAAVNAIQLTHELLVTGMLFNNMVLTMCVSSSPLLSHERLQTLGDALFQLSC